MDYLADASDSLRRLAGFGITDVADWTVCALRMTFTAFESEGSLKIKNSVIFKIKNTVIRAEIFINKIKKMWI